jgi:hypothetical protein
MRLSPAHRGLILTLVPLQESHLPPELTLRTHTHNTGKSSDGGPSIRAVVGRVVNRHLRPLVQFVVRRGC